MTRVTYRKQNDNLLVSRNDLIAINKFVKVELDIVNLSGTILLKDSNEKLGTIFHAKNLAALKKEAKKRLALEGVNFTDEVRPRVKLESNQTVNEVVSNDSN